MGQNGFRRNRPGAVLKPFWEPFGAQNAPWSDFPAVWTVFSGFLHQFPVFRCYFSRFFASVKASVFLTLFFRLSYSACHFSIFGATFSHRLRIHFSSSLLSTYLFYFFLPFLHSSVRTSHAPF